MGQLLMIEQHDGLSDEQRSDLSTFAKDRFPGVSQAFAKLATRSAGWNALVDGIVDRQPIFEVPKIEIADLREPARERARQQAERDLQMIAHLGDIRAVLLDQAAGAERAEKREVAILWWTILTFGVSAPGITASVINGWVWPFALTLLVVLILACGVVATWRHGVLKR